MIYLPVLTPESDLGIAFNAVPWPGPRVLLLLPWIWLCKLLCDSSWAHALTFFKLVRNLHHFKIKEAETLCLLSQIMSLIVVLLFKLCYFLRGVRPQFVSHRLFEL